jgi:2,4-dienoyl-CoA reductase-like NADH-dependent reductase (Old Yellow Enzyme family)
MSKLFEASEINGLKLKNRFVRSATLEGMAAVDGTCTPRLTEYMADLARGGVGLIISSHCYVQNVGKVRNGQLGIHTDEMIPGLREMTRAVHATGGKIVCQLSHAGYLFNLTASGETPIAPSNIAVAGLAEESRKEMTREDIQEVIDAFATAAARARTAGFDGVQIHGAHGYLISEFISPLFNNRTDEYGGSIQNRLRLPLEVLEAIRRNVGDDFPILIKINCKEFTDQGLMPEEFLQVGKTLTDAGIDAIEVSGGLLIKPKMLPNQLGINKEEKEAYFQHEAKALKQKINIPVFLVGGNRSFHIAERLVAEGAADYISMSRPFIREPHLINRWKAGDLKKAACVSDNLCFQPLLEGKGIYCVSAEREKNR